MILEEKAVISIVAGIYGVFGSFAHYFWEVMKNKEVKFNPFFFFMNGFLGFFIGVVVGDFIPSDFVGRDGLILICGFLVYQILQIIEEGGIKIILKKLGIIQKK